MEYTDKGFSGKNTNRPGFEKIMNDIRAGKIKRVIVCKLDRISRSILDFANMMEIFQKYHVEFVSSTEKFDTSTPIGRAMLNICIVFAQLERETIQKRVTDAYYARCKRGFCIGGRIPYDYRLTNTVIDNIRTSMYEEVSEESDQLKLIYSMYADTGNSLGDLRTDIADIQNTVLMTGGSRLDSTAPFLKLSGVHKPGDLFPGQSAAPGLILPQDTIRRLNPLGGVEKAEAPHQADGKGDGKNNENTPTPVGFHAPSCQFLFYNTGIIFKRPCHVLHLLFRHTKLLYDTIFSAIPASPFCKGQLKHKN